MSSKFNLYKIFGYRDKDIIAIEKLIEIVNDLDIHEEADEALFQFHPKLVSDDEKVKGFNEHEPWFCFHKNMIIGEIIFAVLEKNIDNEYDRDYEINRQIEDEHYSFILEDYIKGIISLTDIQKKIKQEYDEIKVKEEDNV